MQSNYLRHLGHIIDQKKRAQRMKLLTAIEQPTIPPEFNPKDYLSFLIHVDAELEHGLMVQYLYAAYSMGGDQIEEKDREKVKRWQEIILGIAKEEMGHFVSVQNVLKVIGAPLNFGRQDFPWDSKLYPFEFCLEPFTLNSLAKYVYAESPEGWIEPSPDDDQETLEIKQEIRNVLQDTEHGDPVGVIFAEVLSIIKDPKLIPDNVFLPETYPLQAKFDEWGRGYKGGARGNSTLGNPKGAPDVLVAPLSSRSDTVAALEAIAEQGEATSGEENELSHFERFLGIYKELRTMPVDFSPSRNVAFNPTIAEGVADPSIDPSEGETSDQRRDIIENPLAQTWANLFNVRYRMLLTLLKHSFLLDDGFNYSGAYSPRGTIIHSTFGEMYNLRSIANVLVKLPISTGSDIMAGPPFLIPYTIDLPSSEASRWRVHQDLLEASGALIEVLLQSGDESNHKYLYSLREADKQLNNIAEKITAVPA
ncbi:ferritin-like domain-containing protein [Rapidithrix thailandica]|uniref:Ferritin-like domain-containing protein n=1 Tax=Rapidithrix thailandica TaxID=413964 RepID=A0AAW9SFV9_9BACT